MVGQPGRAVSEFDRIVSMPVNVYRVTPGVQKHERVAWLCDGEWLLRPQIEALSAWLEENTRTLPPGGYVADVGFCWHRNARAGGPVLEPAALRYMADLGMSLFLSEYPGFADRQPAKNAEGDSLG